MAQHIAIESSINGQVQVEGHFDPENAWYTYHERMREPLGNLVGGKRMKWLPLTALPSTLNLLLTTFYRPTNTI